MLVAALLPDAEHERVETGEGGTGEGLQHGRVERIPEQVELLERRMLQGRQMHVTADEQALERRRARDGERQVAERVLLLPGQGLPVGVEDQTPKREVGRAEGVGPGVTGGSADLGEQMDAAGLASG